MPLVVYSGVSLLLVMAVRAPADADAADDLEGRLELLVISDAVAPEYVAQSSFSVPIVNFERYSDG